IKIDMQKAYDSIEWAFLEQVLTGLCFPRTFIGWIMECLKIISYSISVNGSPTTPFEAKRGVRQGDPVSPLLFILAMEYLTRSLKQLKEEPNFNYHPRCEKLNIIQLSFADDLLLFWRGDGVSIQLLCECFNKFSKASGLVANQSKSCMYFGGVPADIQQDIIQATGFTIGAIPFRYLGVPLSSKRLSVSQCQPLLDKMPGKIKQWITKFLSYAGRLQLIKNTNASKKALVAWEKICRPKSKGGLNITDLSIWNRAALIKHLWNVCMKKDKVWIRWVHVYYIK
ncbi:hypothetical protein A4A49_57378, partial [Nicotiana attenuata]